MLIAVYALACYMRYSLGERGNRSESTLMIFFMIIFAMGSLGLNLYFMYL